MVQGVSGSERRRPMLGGQHPVSGWSAHLSRSTSRSAVMAVTIFVTEATATGSLRHRHAGPRCAEAARVGEQRLPVPLDQGGTTELMGRHPAVEPYAKRVRVTETIRQSRIALSHSLPPADRARTWARDCTPSVAPVQTRPFPRYPCRRSRAAVPPGGGGRAWLTGLAVGRDRRVVSRRVVPGWAGRRWGRGRCGRLTCWSRTARSWRSGRTSVTAWTRRCST